jgi:hypothetical protein
MLASAEAQISESFLVLFFKKEQSLALSQIIDVVTQSNLQPGRLGAL